MRKGYISVLTSLVLVALVVLALIFVPFEASSEGDLASPLIEDGAKSVQNKTKRSRQRPRVHNLESNSQPVLL